jgi:PTH1 family peptidyl-tRNA hydrolase
MYCIVGLGNPGEEYAETRHNVGFRVVDELAKSKDTHIWRPEFRALTATVRVGRTEVLVMKPQTYMNRSGVSVAAALSEKGLVPANLLVIYDDVDLPLGRVRVRSGGGTGGHNGVQSIIDEIDDPSFTRVRLGVGRPQAGGDMIEHVLSPFLADEVAGAQLLVDRGVEASKLIVADGVVAAMQTFNALPPALNETNDGE